jgi:hypothetical protein
MDHLGLGPAVDGFGGSGASRIESRADQSVAWNLLCFQHPIPDFWRSAACDPQFGKVELAFVNPS